MEWLFPLMFVAIMVSLGLYLKRQEITGAPYQSTITHQAPKALPTKAKTEQEAKDDWINAFKGEPTEGSHRIVKTWYAEMVRKDGKEWPSFVNKFWPTWQCSCGEKGTVVMRDSDFKAAEKKALERATTHVNDMNYVEWKNTTKLDGRAF